MIENMSRDFLDIKVTWRNKRTGTEVHSFYTRNTYNLPYFMNKVLNDAIKSGDKHGQALKTIHMQECDDRFPGMY